MKTDTDSADKIVEVLPKSLFINDTAGANMDEASGDINVILDNKPSKNHFRESGKFSGMAGSSCDSHPTILLSRSDNGIFAASSLALLFRAVRLVFIRESLLRPLAWVFT